MSQNNGETNKYPIRKSALVSPWGIGAIVPVSSGETFMVAGLDCSASRVSYKGTRL